LYTVTKPPKKLKAIPNAVDLAMDLPGQKSTDENQAITNLKPPTYANTTVTS